MTRLLLPLVLIIAAIGLFVVWTNPTYQASKALQAQVTSYDEALNKSEELQQLRNQLISKRDAFPSDGVTKLTEVLPDNVDNIRLIIDINNIASRHNLTLTNVNLGTVSDSRTQAAPLSVGASGDSVGSVEVSFAVTTSYDTMLAFLTDLEHSLRLIDVDKLSFTSGAGDSATYSFTIRTYWLQ